MINCLILVRPFNSHQEEMFFFCLFVYFSADLGISGNQQRQLGLLFYVLYGNSMILYSPNSTLIHSVISKANSTFVVLDTITKYAHEWRNVSNVLKDYFLANDTERKVQSLRRVQNQRQKKKNPSINNQYSF